MATALHPSSDIQELKKEMKHLATLVQDNLKNGGASTRASNVVGFAADDLQRSARRAGRRLRSFLKEKNKQAVEVRDNWEETITTHPFASVAAAAASGLVLGALFRRM